MIEPGDTIDDAVEGEVVAAEIIEDLTSLELELGLSHDSEVARQELLRHVSEARASAVTSLNDLQRAVADFDNYRKRVQRDQEALVTMASERVVLELLPVLDSFDAAFTHEAQTAAEENILAGVRSTYHQLVDALKKEGLEPIPGVGEPFDPEVHEAAQAPPDNNGELVVTQELRRGYRLHGRVIRPALVAVDHA